MKKQIINFWATSSSPVEFGTIFSDDFARASIGSDYTVTGTAPSLDGTKLTYSASAGSAYLSNRVERNYWQCFEKYLTELTFTVGSAPSATESGPCLGVKETVSFQNWEIFASFHTTSGGSNDGKITLYVGNGASNDNNAAYTLRGTSSAISVVNGRSYKLSLERTIGTTGATFTATILDLTSLATASVSWNEDITTAVVGGNSYANKTARPMFASLGGTFSVTAWNFSPTSQKNINTLFIGDSITHGLLTTSMSTRWASAVGATLPSYEICAGASKKTADIVNQLTNILQYNPRVVYLFVGTNDVVGGGAGLTTAQTNYPTIVSTIKAAGITVKHILALPRTASTHINTWNAWIQSTYPSDIIYDVNTPTNNGSNTMLPTFLSADGVHPTYQGARVIQNILLNSGTFTLDVAATFSPVSWFRNGSTYMASDGSSWTDSGSGGYTATAAGGARPTYNATGGMNSKPSFTFDGVANVMTTARMTAIQGINKLTMIVVGKNPCFSHDEGTASGILRTSVLQNGNFVYGSVGNGAGSYGYYSYASTNYGFYTMIYDGTQSTNATKLVQYLKGVVQSLSIVSTIPTTTENNASSIGKIGKTTTAFVGGEIFEILIIPRLLTANELLDLHSLMSITYKV